jgi:hypothetical protein
LYTLTRTIVWHIEWWTQVLHNGICQDMHWKAPSVYKMSILCLIFEIIPSTTTQLIDTSSIVVNGFLLSPQGPYWACLLDDLISTDYRILFLYLSQKNDNNNHQSASHLDLSCEVLFLISSLVGPIFNFVFWSSTSSGIKLEKSPVMNFFWVLCTITCHKVSWLIFFSTHTYMNYHDLPYKDPKSRQWIILAHCVRLLALPTKARILCLDSL